MWGTKLFPFTCRKIFLSLETKRNASSLAIFSFHGMEGEYNGGKEESWVNSYQEQHPELKFSGSGLGRMLQLTSETAELQRFIVHRNNSCARWAELLPRSSCSQKYFPSWTPSPVSCPDSIRTKSPRIYVPVPYLGGWSDCLRYRFWENKSEGVQGNWGNWGNWRNWGNWENWGLVHHPESRDAQVWLILPQPWSGVRAEQGHVSLRADTAQPQPHQIFFRQLKAFSTMLQHFLDSITA